MVKVLYNVTRVKFMKRSLSTDTFERKSTMMNKRLNQKVSKRWTGIRRLLLITMVLFISSTLYSGALGEEATKTEPITEDAPYLMMERVTDFFSGDNFKILEDARDRIDELTDSIGRGSERIGESIERLTDFIGFGGSDSEDGEREGAEADETSEEEQAAENNTPGQVVGTFTSKEGDPLENIRVNLGNYATYTNERGEFAFADLPYGAYTLSYQESQGAGIHNIEEILIDSSNDRYVISMVLDTGGAGEVLAEEDSEREIVVDTSPADAIEDREIEDEDSRMLIFIVFMILILLLIILFFIINRKHIKTIDGRTGETLGKKKIDIKPVTWIDLTEEFQDASGEKIRVRFIRSAIRKLCGKKVVFTVDDTIIAEIPEYTGELDFLVQRWPVEEVSQNLEEPRD